MRKLKYNQDKYDWKLFALEHIEKDIEYFSRQFKINGMDDDDVAQELREKMWLSLDKFDHKKSRLQTWSNRVMRNCLLNINKRQNRKKRYFVSVSEVLSEKEISEL